MGESVRQAKLNRLLQKELSEVFLREGKQLFDNSFISVTQVKVAPDLGFAKVYISFLNEKDKTKALNLVKLHTKDLRSILAMRIKSIVRKIPELDFYYDDTLDVAEQIEGLIKEIKAKPTSTKPLDLSEYGDDLDVK